MASTARQGTHERRILRRSRLGCRNCKLRKLKCDESKPHCRRCTSFGVLCNYALSVPDLQPIAPGTGKSLMARGRTPLLSPPVGSPVWSSDASTHFQMNAKCQDFVTRYLGRSLLTPHDPNMCQVNRRLLKLAFAYPCLMHASLAVALTYDRSLNTSSPSPRTVEECYHWSQGTVLLNKRLEEPIDPEDRDPIWGTAAALAILSFASPDASTPEESWPMTTSGQSDLDWVRMSKGKMSLWHIVNPLRPDSIFSIMTGTYAQMNSPMPEKGAGGIPIPLAAACLLNESSTAETSPYFSAAHAVSHILDLPDDDISTGNTEIFRRCIHGRFQELLRNRDPVALLLLYLYYRKAGRSIWWIELRARVECPSICLYLQLHHRDNLLVQALLPGGAFAEIHTWHDRP
ncbi:hypothetical protein B0I35DRAFT_481553 [Stachybotrys elegans]|uniref:Zn(2)-C6 fungal-type domain-containing protein n=1 Tax=Stachybotrys elegans TaxID=80388 RepID=A0A8K0SJX5_9HYPO|nr:hypothetical protein B0I35DRAFT_481553 [Stachybotrys elegans]